LASVSARPLSAAFTVPAKKKPGQPARAT